MPHKKTLGLYKGLPKPYTSILIQMRSQRIGLRHFLFKIATTQQRAEGATDRCHCDEGSQTPMHVLLQCPLYTALRATMLNKVWYKTDLGRTTDYDTIISDSQAIRYVAEFMHRTGLLGQFRQVDYEDVDASINTPE
ncbi:hypothetical protein PENARI_c051G02094 [Penicillium arizonense]|uniref:Reverse transcriptase zinc-binding domain-containing protein n=1 Tax=Penicillium arizonense TaxID=1835702 RepID=A0A1F5L241_PENAI|nr:hypothetical protein PENARI_c051G02094 [Penicillium arizonense]OGE47274.1 hypothetical protein PENARI_c051G02094 [Penicillium arizonense]